MVESDHHHHQSSSIIIINEHRHQSSSLLSIIVNHHHHQSSSSIMINHHHHHHYHHHHIIISIIIIIVINHITPVMPLLAFGPHACLFCAACAYLVLSSSSTSYLHLLFRLLLCLLPSLGVSTVLNSGEVSYPLLFHCTHFLHDIHHFCPTSDYFVSDNFVFDLVPPCTT